MQHRGSNRDCRSHEHAALSAVRSSASDSPASHQIHHHASLRGASFHTHSRRLASLAAGLGLRALASSRPRPGPRCKASRSRSSAQSPSAQTSSCPFRWPSMASGRPPLASPSSPGTRTPRHRHRRSASGQSQGPMFPNRFQTGPIRPSRTTATATAHARNTLHLGAFRRQSRRGDSNPGPLHYE